MFFSSKPNGILYVRRDGLTLYNNAGKSAQLTFGSDTVEYVEVLDARKLTELIAQFVAAQPGANKLKLMCLLDDFVVFQKLLPLAGTDSKKAAADFESKLPFDPEDRTLLTLQTKDQLVLLGTNKEFCLVVVSAFAAAGCRVLSVSPAVIYSAGKTALTPEAVQKILASSSLADKANFLSGGSLLT